MLQTKRKPTFRINGKRHKSNTYVPPRNGNSSYTPSRSERLYNRIKDRLGGSYAVEKLVGFMALSLLMIAGIRLAVQAGYGDPFMIAGQIAGFTASTVFIIRLKTKLSAGQYIGRQRKLAESLFYTGVVFESLTLFAKFFPVIIPFYLGTVTFSIPALVIASFRIIYLDPVSRLENDNNEKDILETTLVKRQEILTAKVEIIDDLGKLEAKDLMHELKREKRIKLVKKNHRRIGAIAKKENEDDLKDLEKNAGLKYKRTLTGWRYVKSRLDNNSKNGVSDAKVLPAKKSRKKKGPTNDPKNVNRKNCKNPKCNNKLTGKQEVACCGTCRTAVNRAVKDGIIEKTW